MTTGPHKVADETAIVKDDKAGYTKIYPRGLNITWGNDDRYWRITDPNDSKNPYVAELKQVSWLEVTCSTDNVEVWKTYKVSFSVSLKPDAFGWNGVDVYVMAKVGKSGKFTPKKVSLGDKQSNEKMTIPKEPLEITVDPSKTEEQKSIYFGLYEVWSSNWKGGILIHEATVERVD